MGPELEWLDSDLSRSYWREAGVSRDDYPDALGIAKDEDTGDIVVWTDSREFRFQPKA